jgi:hypothetical protein
MKRSLWLIFATLTPIAAIGLFRFQPEKRSEAAPPVGRLADVRVQHDYVTVTMPVTGGPVITTLRNRLANARPAETASASRAMDRQGETERASPSRYRQVNPASRDQTLFEKARRAFVGDGRHRPEPFPRPRAN